MNNVKFIEVETMGVTTTHAIIDRGNGEFTSMPKEIYDALPVVVPTTLGE
jgi:hypothetical protein